MPGHEAWGGWGGRFTPNKILNYWSRHSEFYSNELANAPFYVFGDSAKDIWVDPETNTSYNTIYSPEYRWRRAINNDFRGRMDWCIKPYNQANHNPKAVFRADTTDTIIVMSVVPGELVDLSASSSTDPDNDKLYYKWFIYPEAGTYTGTFSIVNSTSATTNLTIPNNAQGYQIHIILQVNDSSHVIDTSGNLSMYDYRRIILNVEASTALKSIGQNQPVREHEGKLFTTTDRMILPVGSLRRNSPITVFDFSGTIVARTTVAKQSISLKKDLFLPPGVYMIQVGQSNE
jgi:hypothetical protein